MLKKRKILFHFCIAKSTRPGILSLTGCSFHPNWGAFLLQRMTSVLPLQLGQRPEEQLILFIPIKITAVAHMLLHGSLRQISLGSAIAVAAKTFSKSSE